MLVSSLPGLVYVRLIVMAVAVVSVLGKAKVIIKGINTTR